MGDEMQLESADAYVKKASADISKAKSNAANLVTIVLAIAVGCVPVLFVVGIGLLPETKLDVLTDALGDWMRIVGPILGTAIGALLGVSLAKSVSESSPD